MLFIFFYVFFLVPKAAQKEWLRDQTGSISRTSKSHETDYESDPSTSRPQMHLYGVCVGSAKKSRGPPNQEREFGERPHS
jgi:hypothetical protein